MTHLPAVFLQASTVALVIALCPLGAAAQGAATIKIGKVIKNTTGVVKELQVGDVACYMEMRDDHGKEFTELADFEICSQTPSLIGKRVGLEYKIERVIADECMGAPDCKVTRKVAMVVKAKIIAPKGAR